MYMTLMHTYRKLHAFMQTDGLDSAHLPSSTYFLVCLEKNDMYVYFEFGNIRARENKGNKKHSENADTSTSVTFDLVV